MNSRKRRLPSNERGDEAKRVCSHVCSPDAQDKGRHHLLSPVSRLESNLLSSASSPFSPGSGEPTTGPTVVKTTEEALSYLRSLFPVHKFEDRIPPIIWQHQLYALLKKRTRTEVDRKLNGLCDEGQIRFFKLGTTLTVNEVAIVFYDDYSAFLKTSANESTVVDKFLNKVVAKCPAMSFTRHQLSHDYALTEENVTELVRKGLLAVHQSVGHLLLSIPNAGLFVKSYLVARKALIGIIKRSKFGEIRREDLEMRKLPKEAKLGMEYHILDLIGSDCVQCIESPTGTILRL